MFSAPPVMPLSLPPPMSVPTADVQLVPYGVEIPNRVFVGGCPYNMTEKELGDFFCQFGPIKDSKIVFDKATGKSLGYGFVTYESEFDAMNVYARGSIYYNEKKLNVSKAVRKHGGQFHRPNQEFVNGNQVFVHPSGYLLAQHEGAWQYQPPSPHSQPVKPCYALYMGPNMQQQPPVPYGMQSPTFAPIGTPTFISSPIYHDPLHSPHTLTHHTPTLYQPQSNVTAQQIITSHATSNELNPPIENALQVSEIESNLANSHDNSVEDEKEGLELVGNSFKSLALNDSAYASDDRSPINSGDSSGSPSSEPRSSVNLDNMFSQRRSPHQRKKFTRKRNDSSKNTHTQPVLSSPPLYGTQTVGLLPHPTAVGYPVGGYVPL